MAVEMEALHRRLLDRADHSFAPGKFNDAVSIRGRPADIEDRAVPRHWEGDLITGSGNSFIATLAEWHTRLVMLARVDNKDSYSVIHALIKQSRKLPKELYRFLTWDRVTEMARTAPGLPEAPIPEQDGAL